MGISNKPIMTKAEIVKEVSKSIDFKNQVK